MPNSASQELATKRHKWQKRSTALYNFLKQNLGEILSGVGASALTILGLTPIRPESTFITWSIVVGAVVLLVTGWLLRNRQRKLVEDLEEEIASRDLQIERFESRADKHLKLIELIVQDWCQEAGVWDTSTRITVYGYDSQNAVLRPLIRASENKKLSKPGRKEYPPEDGYIGRVWEEKTICVNRCMTKTSKNVLRAAGLPDSEIDRIMHPLSFAGFRCESVGQTYGVVFIESTKQKLIDNNKFDTLLQSDRKEMVERWVATEGVWMTQNQA